MMSQRKNVIIHDTGAIAFWMTTHKPPHSRVSVSVSVTVHKTNKPGARICTHPTTVIPCKGLALYASGAKGLPATRNPAFAQPMQPPKRDSGQRASALPTQSPPFSGMTV
jgi:hypothetical protein